MTELLEVKYNLKRQSKFSRFIRFVLESLVIVSDTGSRIWKWFICSGSLGEDSKKSIAYFEKALEIDPNDIETLTLKTNAHLSLQQKDEAIECCKKITALDPKNYEAHGLLEKLESLWIYFN